ncbi:hypothetical protein ACN93_07695 [Gordonia paraffinivorans]|nr:hypothetical protein ACN93_07695 [Gordonia paraffinivorans]
MGSSAHLAGRTLVRESNRFLSGVGVALAVGTGGSVPGVGSASAAPLITCAGAICTNHGNTWGIGYGRHQCSNGLSYPSIAVVPPHGTAAVLPANCGPATPLY